MKASKRESYFGSTTFPWIFNMDCWHEQVAKSGYIEYVNGPSIGTSNLLKESEYES